ncbi:uncharacterized protein C8A04DRAFT_28704 [Dichotomopilus funicola]|uniref:Cellobiose dehydrogenase-like cytochrome domain-containing protein n=1 Tax=Dichotomopilus funicola TaxID=1934379 RepID=A0AAN6ZMM7_9PEZI|nr:hypothetical protein C8A04DRAFT_28704 [Dichotomopilus funicola]
MLRTLVLGLAAALIQTAAADTVHDSETGLTFSSAFQLYKSGGHGITFRVAIPDDAQSNAAYDAVVQVIAPSDVGWTGLAWGGSMPKDPLLISWQGPSGPVLSSRWASGHVAPTSYTGAQYTLFRTGTKSNGTHWQFTALCKGCTAWDSSGSGSGPMRYLNPAGSNRLAFAYSPTKPSGSADANIAVHEVHAYWSHDFAQARNADFAATIQRLVGA